MFCSLVSLPEMARCFVHPDVMAEPNERRQLGESDPIRTAASRTKRIGIQVAASHAGRMELLDDQRIQVDEAIARARVASAGNADLDHMSAVSKALVSGPALPLRVRGVKVCAVLKPPVHKDLCDPPVGSASVNVRNRVPMESEGGRGARNVRVCQRMPVGILELCVACPGGVQADPRIGIIIPARGRGRP